MKHFVVVAALWFSSFAFGQVNYAGCLDSLNIMSSFTPNGDGANDVFWIYFPCPPENFVIHIYNRWGQEIYDSNSPDFAWDGNDTKKNPLPAGVYFYTLSFSYLGEKKEITGNLSLIR